MGDFKKNVVSYFRKFLIDNTRIDAIVSLSDQKTFEKVNISNDDIFILNEIMDYLSNYNNDNLVNDFNLFMNNLDCRYVLEFYVYFLYLFVKFNSDNVVLNSNLKNNIVDLFYLLDVEVLFNSEKFRLHYSGFYLDEFDIDCELNQELVLFIDKHVSKGNYNELETTIIIYYWLCKIFEYDSRYVVYNDLKRTSDIEKIDFNNNKVVCAHFSTIYYKFLKKYGIDCNLAGDRNHVFVNFRIGSMMLKADSTRCGYFDVDYTLSDLTSVKYDFLIDGLFLVEEYYTDFNYIKRNKKKLNDTIKSVYKSLGISLDNRNKFNNLLRKYQINEFSKEDIITKEVIDRRISFLNSIFYKVCSEVEDVQMLTKLVRTIFADIEGDHTEEIILYKVINNEVKLTKLLVLYDWEMNPYYYFDVDGQYVNYEVDDIVSLIIDGGWLFKNQNSIDALYLADDKVDKLLLSLNVKDNI